MLLADWTPMAMVPAIIAMLPAMPENWFMFGFSAIFSEMSSWRSSR